MGFLRVADYTRLVPWNRNLVHNSRAGHPDWRRCFSLTYAQYSRSSRLASRAPRSRTYPRNHGSRGLAVCGESPASHRHESVGPRTRTDKAALALSGRSATRRSRTRRDHREYRLDVGEDQRRPRGRVARRIQADSRHGPSGGHDPRGATTRAVVVSESIRRLPSLPDVPGGVSPAYGRRRWPSRG